LTIDEITDQADVMTGRRAPKELDKKTLLIQLIQEFCQEKRFFWRRKTVTFTTTSGTQAYDLTASAGANAYDLDEIISLKYVKSTSEVWDVLPVFDAAAVAESLADTTTGEPGTYAAKDGSENQINIFPIPSGTYTLRLTYWAVPDIASVTTQAVPLVPKRYHRTLVFGLASVLAAAIIPADATKAQAMQQLYLSGLQKAIDHGEFDVTKRLQFLDGEDDAIRSID
jgi:hypothetical protein